jgi:hypothetical protein
VLLDVAVVEAFDHRAAEDEGQQRVAAGRVDGDQAARRVVLLFPESDARVAAAIHAIDTRGPEDGPAEVLLRTLHRVGEDSDDMTSRLAALRLRLVREVPAVRGRALQIQLDAQQEIARHLAAAFPDRLDAVSAAALVGAFVGAVTGALQVLLADGGLDDPAAVQAAVQRATDVALTPWLHGADVRPPDRGT